MVREPADAERQPPAALRRVARLRPLQTPALHRQQLLRHRALCSPIAVSFQSFRPKLLRRRCCCLQVEWFIPAFERWREEMGLHQPFTLVGHSMGAMLATEWARVHPSRIRKLVNRTG